MNTHKSERVLCANYDWTIFQRTDNGVYYADGRKHGNGKHSLGTRDRCEAISAIFELDKYISKNSPCQIVGPAKEGNLKVISIEDGWERYVAHRDIPIHLGGLKQSSKSKYSGHKKRFSRFCRTSNSDNWSKVDKELLKKYAKHLEGKLAPVTIHDDLTMEMSVSNWLIKEGLIPQDCKFEWKIQKPAGSESYCYERNEVSRMLQFTRSFAKNQWLYPTIFLLSRTGIRIGEAQNLKWSDVDLKNEVIHVRDESFLNKSPGERRHVKDGESRIIPLTIDLHEFLNRHKRVSGYVLTGDRGGRLNYNHIREAFVTNVIVPLSSEFPGSEDKPGFITGRFHSFRHFFVSECFAAGVPESDIRLWVGHSDSKVVALYRHIRSDIAKANIRKINFGNLCSQRNFT